MLSSKKYLRLIIVVCVVVLGMNKGFCSEEIKQEIHKYPDYSYIFVGKDKCENFNRRMFRFDGGLNRFVIRPLHILWASIIPQYGMDRVMGLTTNVEYPIRLVSCLAQKDFKASKTETVRFLTNSTVGLGGMFDPAKKFLKIEPVQEDMEQALAKTHMKSGPFLVLPALIATTPRNLVGKILDAGLNPSSYIGTPILAAVKAGIFVNRTAILQPLYKMIEPSYADPYEITKKLYGLENYIKLSNFDRESVLEQTSKEYEQYKTALADNIVPVNTGVIEGSATADNIIYKDKENILKPDIILKGYNPQHPVTDSMRTAFFELPGINDSIWNELSLWNRCFAKKIKTSSVNIEQGRENYSFRYILQKDKNAPVAIIYPSIGEGINSHHSVVLAKIFYDEGYSVVIQGSNFQWEFVKSMPLKYCPGKPLEDAQRLQDVSSKILAKLENKYACKFSQKVVIGTSMGALETLFLAYQESVKNTLGVNRYISINPPIELLYALKQIDKNSEEWALNPNDLQNRVAVTAAKIVKVTEEKKSKDFKISTLPFSEDESKLITGFILHQKLSDLVFSMENVTQTKKDDFHEIINDFNYDDYAKKYLLNDDKNIKDIAYQCSLHRISDFLKKSNNYRIYHSLDDYLTNTSQLIQLKKYTGSKTILISNGGHLGFMYRPEFIDSLKNEISLHKKI